MKASLGTKYLSTYDDNINGRNKVLLFIGEEGLSLDNDDDDSISHKNY